MLDNKENALIVCNCCDFEVKAETQAWWACSLLTLDYLQHVVPAWQYRDSTEFIHQCLCPNSFLLHHQESTIVSNSLIDSPSPQHQTVTFSCPQTCFCVNGVLAGSGHQSLRPCPGSGDECLSRRPFFFVSNTLKSSYSSVQFHTGPPTSSWD